MICLRVVDEKSRAARIAELKARREADLAELTRLLQEELADRHGLSADERAAFMGLTSGEQKRMVNSSMMTAVHKVAISAGRKKKDAFLQAIRAKGYTLRGLAAKLDIPPSLISMYRSGDRPIPKARAAEIESLTDWKATRANWPGGIA